MVKLGALDLVICLAFAAAVVGLALSAKNRSGKAVDYMVAGRNISLPTFVATLVSTWYGGILGVGESASYFGLGTWVLIGVPYYLFGLIYALTVSRRVRESDSISIPDRMAVAFGSRAGLVAASLMFLLAAPAAHVFMLAKLAQWGLGLSPIVSLVAAAAVTLLLIAGGGMLSDVRIGILAFLAMFAGFGAIFVYNVATHPWADVVQRLAPPQRTWDGSTGWPFVLSFMILGAWTMVDPAFHQRVTSSASPDLAKRGVLISVLCWMVFDILSITCALYAITLLREPVQDPMLLYPEIARQWLPAGLRGLFLCGLVGTVVSGLAGYTLVSGIAFGQDIMGSLRRERSEASTILWTRVGLVIAIALAAVVAHWVNSVVNLWYSWAGAIVGAMLVPTLVAYRSPKTREAGGWAAAAMLLAFGLTIGWMGYGLASGNPFLSIAMVHQPGGIQWILPNDNLSEPMKQLVASSQQVSVGTLLPGLAVSTLVMAIGWGLNKRKAYEPISD